MRVKRYLVETMPEAMLQIRNDLGNDAVILSTKETKIGGFLGMFKQKKIEVIAAVEKDEQTKAVEQPPPAPVPPQPQMTVPKMAVPQAYKKAAEAAAIGASKVEDKRSLPESSGLPTSERNQEKETFTYEDESARIQALSETFLEDADKAREARTEALKGLYSSYEAAAATSEVRPAEEKLLEEIRQMKEWMAKIARQSQLMKELPEPLQNLRDRFLDQGIEMDLMEEWMDDAAQWWEESGGAKEDADLSAFMKGKVESFLSGRFGGGISQDTKIVYIAGPTGVGKTTTIAKLAAEQLFRYQRKVGFITSDTYRISAVEQLRTYAAILNVPLEVVQSPGDMQRAISRLSYCDLILMDTAGRNYRNELLVSELQSLLTQVDKSETYLVLSLTSKSQDMKKITEHFSKYGIDKVIFTKLDETGGYGAIFNLIREYPLCLSYMTNGQNVPDDLLLPDDQKLCKLLLGDEMT